VDQVAPVQKGKAGRHVARHRQALLQRHQGRQHTPAAATAAATAAARRRRRRRLCLLSPLALQVQLNCGRGGRRR
jgi:hypothetical protein